MLAENTHTLVSQIIHIRLKHDMSIHSTMLIPDFTLLLVGHSLSIKQREYFKFLVVLHIIQ